MRAGPRATRSVPLADSAGAGLVHDTLASVDPDRRMIRTGSGAELAYDALLIGVGAAMQPFSDHTTNVDDRRMDDAAARTGPGHRGGLHPPAGHHHPGPDAVAVPRLRARADGVRAGVGHADRARRNDPDPGALAAEGVRGRGQPGGVTAAVRAPDRGCHHRVLRGAPTRPRRGAAGWADHRCRACHRPPAARRARHQRTAQRRRGLHPDRRVRPRARARSCVGRRRRHRLPAQAGRRGGAAGRHRGPRDRRARRRPHRGAPLRARAGGGPDDGRHGASTCGRPR